MLAIADNLFDSGQHSISHSSKVSYRDIMPDKASAILRQHCPHLSGPIKPRESVRQESIAATIHALSYSPYMLISNIYCWLDIDMDSDNRSGEAIPACNNGFWHFVIKYSQLVSSFMEKVRGT